MSRRLPVPLIAALGLIVAVAGCGSSKSGGSSAGGSAGASVKGKDVTVVLGVKGFEYYTTLGCGAADAGRALGMNVSVVGASQFSPTAQIPLVNSVTAKHPDAAVIAPTDTKALVPPIQQMQSAGVTVVEADTATDPPLGEAQLTTDNHQAGVIGAQTIAQLMGDRGKVLIVSTAPGVSTEDERIVGFREEMRKHPGITVLAPQYDGANLERSASIVGATLGPNPDLGGIFTTNLLSSEGVTTGVKQASKVGAVKIVAFDAGPKQLEDLKSGAIQGAIAQMPYEEGRAAVQQAANALAGKPVEQTRQFGVVALTRDNLGQTERYVYRSGC